MYAKHIKPYIIHGERSLAEAHWKLTAKDERTLFVVDQNEKIAGFLKYDYKIPKYTDEIRTMTAYEACQKNFSFVVNNTDIYMHARNLFAQYPQMTLLPVIDEERNIDDILFRFQCFYREYYENWANSKTLRSFFPKPHYAMCIWNAAEMAQKLSYDHISVIEYGVSSGNGLIACEYHAKEIAAIFGIKIDVYGFDNAIGLPPIEDYRDMHPIWTEGAYAMNVDDVLSRLTYANLVLGDIKDTIKTFIKTYNPAPIGAMLVDVDWYSSCVPILDFLTNEDTYFLPIVQMYFDDITKYYSEFQGEGLALREFNKLHENMKITPETTSYNFSPYGRIKQCIRFFHKKYKTGLMSEKQNPVIPLYI